MLELLALMTAVGGRYSPSNASQAYGLQTPSDALPAFGALKKTTFGGLKTAFGRHSPNNASPAYGLQTSSDALPPYTVVA